jgi:hypothetical protein
MLLTISAPGSATIPGREIQAAVRQELRDRLLVQLNASGVGFNINGWNYDEDAARADADISLGAWDALKAKEIFREVLRGIPVRASLNLYDEEARYLCFQASLGSGGVKWIKYPDPSPDPDMSGEPTPT